MQIVDTGKYSSLKLVNYMYLIRCIHHLEDIVFVACRIRYQKCTESIPEEIAQNFTEVDIDDILIWVKYKKEHNRKLRKM